MQSGKWNILRFAERKTCIFESLLCLEIISLSLTASDRGIVTTSNVVDYVEHVSLLSEQ